MRSAVLFLAFKRPGITRKVFDALRQAKPPRLYIACDGARIDHPEEIAAVKEVREVVSNVDWSCDLKTLFRQQNLGCKKAVVTAIDWFFQNEEEGVILEDDCLPHPDFFPYCDELLAKYRQTPSVWVISGNNFQNGRRRGTYPYYFSKYPHTWGWATWKRCWKHFDGDLSFWPEWKESRDYKAKISNASERAFWSNVFDRMYAGTDKVWDYQWVAALWKQNGLSVIPQNNLVSNIGYGDSATHTFSASPTLGLPAVGIEVDDNHPEEIAINKAADEYTFRHVFKQGARGQSSIMKSIKSLNWFLGAGTTSSSDLRQRVKFVLARVLLGTPLYKMAFSLLSQLKAQRSGIRNIDLMRARICLRQGFTGDAIEMLKEELRLFPDNHKASLALKNIKHREQSRQPSVGIFAKEDEFDQLYEDVKPFTMVGRDRLFALYHGAKRVCQMDLPGNFVECGVAGGGSSALLAWVIKHYSHSGRKLYAFDTFEGMPPPTPKDLLRGTPADSTGWGTGTCAAPVSSLDTIARILDVSDLIVPIKGLFQQTLRPARSEVGAIAVLHMDSDWYESTKVILETLYHNIETGGYVQIDDYGHWEGCKQAVEEFQTERQLNFPKIAIDAVGVYFEKQP